MKLSNTWRSTFAFVSLSRIVNDYNSIYFQIAAELECRCDARDVTAEFPCCMKNEKIYKRRNIITISIQYCIGWRCIFVYFSNIQQAIIFLQLLFVTRYQSMNFGNIVTCWIRTLAWNIKRNMRWVGRNTRGLVGIDFLRGVQHF